VRQPGEHSAANAFVDTPISLASWHRDLRRRQRGDGIRCPSAPLAGSRHPQFPLRSAVSGRRNRGIHERSRASCRFNSCASIAIIDFWGAAAGFGIMLLLMVLGVHVAVAMFAISALGAIIYLGPQILSTFGSQLWAGMNDFILTAIPLFILLGEFLLRRGVTQRTLHGLAAWLSRLPGGLCAPT